MKKLLIFAAVLGVGIASGAVYYKIFRKTGPHLAKMAPARAVLWVEGDDLGASWDQVKLGKLWKSFEKSELFVEANKGWEELVKAADKGEVKELKELGLKLNEQTIRRFIGQDVGFGMLAPASDGAPPSFVFMTRLDRLGIAKDMSVDGDWSKIWEKVSKALAGDKPGETFDGIEIRTKTIEDAKKDIHLALIAGVIVVSDNKDAIKEVIEVEKGKAPSLAAAPAFAAEEAKLPKGELLEGWVDLAFFGDKAKLTKCIQSSAALVPAGIPSDPLKALDGEMLNVWVDDLQAGVPGVAFGLTMSEGDLLDAKLVGSRSQEEVFKDAKEREIPAILPETMFFFQVKNVHDLLRNARTSPAWKALAKSEAMLWIQKKLEKPEDAVKLFSPDAPKDLFTKANGESVKTDG